MYPPLVTGRFQSTHSSGLIKEVCELKRFLISPLKTSPCFPFAESDVLVIAVATVGGLVFILIVLVVIAICVLLFRGRTIKRTGEWRLCLQRKDNLSSSPYWSAT